MYMINKTVYPFVFDTLFIVCVCVHVHVSVYICLCGVCSCVHACMPCLQEVFVFNTLMLITCGVCVCVCAIGGFFCVCVCAYCLLGCLYFGLHVHIVH